jgi:hypothetical protein
VDRFPCLCAPEIPGWLFYPPDKPPPSPLQGDVDLGAIIILLAKIRTGFPGLGTDCQWVVPEKPVVMPAIWLAPDVELQVLASRAHAPGVH